METVRVFFAKEGRLKYISHLDVTRCLARVFHRCGLPIWYTQGFNPHAYLTFALPLPLGVESRCESFDFRLTEEVNYEEVRDRLNAVLPEDLRALRAAAPVMEPGAICWADYRLTIRDEDPATEAPGGSGAGNGIFPCPFVTFFCLLFFLERKGGLSRKKSRFF